jgi:tetratricopeptide (TPR) repeat protein
LLALNTLYAFCQNSEIINDCLVDEILQYMANNQRATGNYSLALGHINDSLKWLKGNNIEGLRLVKKLLILAQIKNNLNLPDEAIEVVKLIKSKIKLNNKQESYYYLYAELAYVRALILKENYLEANKLNSNLIDIIIEKFNKNTILYTDALRFSAVINNYLNNNIESIELFHEIIKINKQLHLSSANEYNSIGNVNYHKSKDFLNAKKYYLEAIEEHKKMVPQDTGNYGLYYRNLGFAYYKNNEFQKALDSFIQSKLILEPFSSYYQEDVDLANQWIVYIKENLLE